MITEASLEEKVNEGTRQDQTSEQFLFCLDLECMSWTLWNVNGIRTHALSAGKPPLERERVIRIKSTHLDAGHGTPLFFSLNGLNFK